MKKAVAFMLIFAMAFCMFACNDSANDNLVTDATKKIVETVAGVIGHSSHSPAKIELFHGANSVSAELSEADTHIIAEIIENGDWEAVEATCDCLYDYGITLDNTVYYYHSSHGTFDNASSGSFKCLNLTDEETALVNEILNRYAAVVHDTVDDLHAISATQPYSQAELCLQPRKSTVAAADFAFKMLREAINTQTNALISPVSLINALAMTANGAKGDTLKQMESVMGADINTFNRDFSKDRINGRGIKTANSIWIKNTPALDVKQDFININKKYYGAEIFEENFNKSTLNNINRWVSDNTDGMIKNPLGELPPDAVMYLINTVLFDAEWKIKYNSDEILENQEFTAENGKKQQVTMLYSEMGCNEYNNFVLGKTEGITKEYSNGYSFAALLPNEGVTVAQALQSFSGSQFVRAVTKHVGVTQFDDGVYLVETKIPKFKFDCSFKFADTLKKLGMPLAFDSVKADFSGISSQSVYPLYISEVYHNTSISFTENGTKAGASTIVEMKCGSAKPPENTKTLYFDRPFIYVIYETDTGIPLFAGTVRDFER